MKIAHIILLAAITGAVFASECRVFSCGTVNQPEGDIARCGESSGEGDNKSFSFQACPNIDDKEGSKAQTCLANQWNKPSDAKDQVNCEKKAFEPSWPTNTFPGKDIGVDGDRCENDDQCYEGTCTNNVCKATRKVDEACDKEQDKQCPVGHWCQEDSQNKNTCKPHLGDGDECLRENACPLTHHCLTVGTDQTVKPKCTAANSLNDGQTFFVTPDNIDSHLSLPKEGLTANPGDREQSRYCTSFSHVLEDPSNKTNLKRQCRKSDRNEKQERIVDGGDGVTCNVITYGSTDFEKPDESGKRETQSLCGFNRDGRGVCPLQVGDDDAQKLMKDGAEATNKLNCHKAGTLSFCSAFFNAASDEVKNADGKKAPLFGFNRALTTVESVNKPDAAQTYANIANNEACILETITQSFWQGLNDSSMSFGVVGAIAAVFVAGLY